MGLFIELMFVIQSVTYYCWGRDTVSHFEGFVEIFLKDKKLQFGIKEICSKMKMNYNYPKKCVEFFYDGCFFYYCSLFLGSPCTLVSSACKLCWWYEGLI